MKQQWTNVILSLLPATVAELNANSKVATMNATHRAARVADGKWSNPVNSMAYATLYRLRKQGRVARGADGVYRITR
jgi:hypothetical protein